MLYICLSLARHISYLCNMRLIAFLLLISSSFGEHRFQNSTNIALSETCSEVATSPSTTVVYSLSPKATNSTGSLVAYSTTSPLHLLIPIWENKTSPACNYSSTPSPTRESSTSATRNASLSTSPPELYSAGWSLRHRDYNRTIWQTLGLLFVMLLPLHLG
jgi:hypothetical protein